ncbi:DUF4059 family protein [Streptococcus hillyeri]|uniref:DUF4059 family protein n=1 Tax=Streptococcus hillyeri TaxID=2282420 RepID=A0A3L9DMQ0_9STRE|nr:DUF4059 family protein [Streptococcus hillyeri]RLY01478.1 DUF4059 family protein [Streptococcus hillyeri]
MLATIYRFYLLGLAMSAVVVLFCLLAWLIYRVARRLDKTKKERQALLYEAFLIFLVTTPILSFAFMAIMVIFMA